MSIKIFPKTFLAALASIIAAMTAPAVAASAAIDSAKGECIVGERSDGYLGVIDEARASEALRREVASINPQRKSAYAKLAERNGVSIEDTAALTAERLIGQAGAGECVQDGSGAWVQR